MRIRAVDEMEAYALHRGVPAALIHIEDQSRSTYENAVYSKDRLKYYFPILLAKYPALRVFANKLVGVIF